MSEARPSADPRAVRVSTAPSTALPGDPVLVVAPAVEPGARYLIDGAPADARLSRLDEVRGRLEIKDQDAAARTDVLLGASRPGPDRGTILREVVVDGWRFEIQVENEEQVRLRERARRGDAAAADGGPVTLRAVIPGRVVAVAVKNGDAVVAGQQLLVVEAMKMQNEIQAPRDGIVERVAVAVGKTIEIGDLLVVIQAVSAPS